MFYYKYFNPKKLIAIELSANPIGVLDNYIQKNRLNDVIRSYYGVDQSDAERLHKIVAADLPGQTLDLVVDDASHFLDETRISFNTLFPYLSSGGHYIIEDWGWAQWPGDKWQKDGGPWPQKLPLTNLILELTLLAASRPDLIDSIFLRPAYAIIRKGRGACEPGIFDLVSNCNNRGNPITLLS